MKSLSSKSRNWRSRQLATLYGLAALGRNTGLSTSVSDSTGYLSVVSHAVKSKKFFSVFRSHPNYMAVLDHVTLSQGIAYLEILIQRGFDLSSLSERLWEFSRIGSPQVEFFPGVGLHAPSVWRYFKVASDLQLLFPNIAEHEITEIGIGWGGAGLGSQKLFFSKKFSTLRFARGERTFQNDVSQLGDHR